jgi:hypothetical protein
MMRKLKLFLCLWMLFGWASFLLMPGARAQSASIPVTPGIAYVRPAQNWSQTLTTSLTGGEPQSLTLTPCSPGVDTTSGFGYQVYLEDGTKGENSEAVNVTGGTCPAAGASSGTIVFTPYFSHPAPGASSYAVKSASSGIQETINIACGTSATYYQNQQCNVTVPANGPADSSNQHTVNTYNIYGTIFYHTVQSTLTGYGASLNCLGRGPCLQVGDRIDSNHAPGNTIQGFSFRAQNCYAPPGVGCNSSGRFKGDPAFYGLAITQTQSAAGSHGPQATPGTATITTVIPHGFRVGDIVNIQLTDDGAFWGDALVASIPSPTTFTFKKYFLPTRDLQNTPGIVALAYEAILDNGASTHFLNIQQDLVLEAANFNHFFDFWDDENALIEHFSNNGTGLNSNANWTASFIYSGGNPWGHVQQWAPVITLRDSNITANGSNGVTVDNSNGLYIENTVIQASGPWQTKVSNSRGNYQGSFTKNLYSESDLRLNPFWNIAGSVKSGVFSIYEKVVQNSTSATGYIQNAVKGSARMLVGTLLGTPDGSHEWVGQSSGAVYTPTSVPIANSPWPGLGIAGLIAGPSTGAANHVVEGIGQYEGAYPLGGSGSVNLSYYVVAHDTTTGQQTSPLPLMTWKSTGSDSIPASWPRIANGTDSITYDIIRTATPGGASTLPSTSAAPSYNGFDNGNCPGNSITKCGYVGALGMTQSSVCGNSLICSYIDNGRNPTSPYKVLQGTYGGPINFWPAPILTESRTVILDTEPSSVVGVGLYGNSSAIVRWCQNYGQASVGGPIMCESTITSNNNSANQAATLMPDGSPHGDINNAITGRLNLGTTPWTGEWPHQIITLVDSNPGLTHATTGLRRPASPRDVWIGVDGKPGSGFAYNAAPLAFGSPASITNYINAPGDGKSWLERLTSTAKIFKVPVQLTVGTFSVLPKCTAATATLGTEGMSAAVSDSTTNAWGATVTGGGSLHVLAYCDGANWTVAAK